MTGIAGLVSGGQVWLAGDRAGVEQGHYLTILGQPKVFRRGNMVFGYTSSFAMGHALQHRMTIPDLPDDTQVEALDRWVAIEFMDAVRETFRGSGFMKTENGRETGGQFLMGVRGELYAVDDDFHAHRTMAGMAACGSGVSVILGALFVSKGRPEDRLLGALAAAQEFTTSVRAPFDVISA